MRSKIAVIAALVAAGVLAAGCGDDDETQAQSSAAPDLERYCEVAQELDAAGEEQFKTLEQDPNATPEEYEQAEAQLVEENQDLLDEAQQVAPAEIQADVATLVAGLRVRAGLDEEGPSRGELSASEGRIQKFEKANCG